MENEIYMIDSFRDNVCVFSHESKMIRSWGK